MAGPQKAPVVCSHSSTKETRSIAVQEPSEATVGAQPRVIMTPISSGGFVQPAFCVTVAIQMVTAVISRSYMVVKCTRLAPLKTKPGLGVLLLTTMTWTSSGAIVEVSGKKVYEIINFLEVISQRYYIYRYVTTPSNP